MTSPAAETYLRTRIGIMGDRLLSAARVRELAASDDLEALRELLPFPLEGEGHGAFTPRRTERLVMHALLHDHNVLLRPMHGHARDLFLFWARRVEIFNLKALIRGKLHGLPEEEISQNLYAVPPVTSLPHQSLLRAENVEELLRQLEDGLYADIARQARLAFAEKHDPLSLDATLDQRYFSGVIQRAARLPEVDRDVLRRLFGTLIDHLNLSWLIRYRLSYELPASETYYLLLAHGKQLHSDLLLKLVELNERGAIFDALPEPLRSLLLPTQDNLSLERILESRLRSVAFGVLHHSPSVIARAFAYLMLRESDLKRLLVILHGRQLGLGHAQISDALHIPETGDMAA